MAKEFEIKALQRLKYFLGIKVAHSNKGIFISPQKYVLDLVKEIGKTTCKPINTLIDSSMKLELVEANITVDRESYKQLVGQLAYLAHTCLDIAYAVNLVSQFMHSPKEVHLQVAHQILQYLKGTLGKGILFRRHGGLSHEAYIHVDYAGSIIDRSSLGYCSSFEEIWRLRVVRNKLW